MDGFQLLKAFASRFHLLWIFCPLSYEEFTTHIGDMRCRVKAREPSEIIRSVAITAVAVSGFTRGPLCDSAARIPGMSQKKRVGVMRSAGKEKKP